MDKDFEMAYAKYRFQTEIIPRLLENDGELLGVVYHVAKYFYELGKKTK